MIERSHLVERRKSIWQLALCVMATVYVRFVKDLVGLEAILILHHNIRIVVKMEMENPDAMVVEDQEFVVSAVEPVKISRVTDDQNQLLQYLILVEHPPEHQVFTGCSKPGVFR